jgi:hypothetical protein
MSAVAERRFSPSKLNELVVVGKDVLELLSSAMYVDPLTIYREYIQNACDAIDEAKHIGLYSNGARPRISISIGHRERAIKITDNGAGVPANVFARRLTALGASKKRGSDARGFRGVGRLCGLAYCEQLVFRSKSKTGPRGWEVSFDCRRLKELLNDSQFRGDVNDVMYQIVEFNTFEDARGRAHFFEVELKGVSRVANDVLLNQTAIRNYLSQVAPVPFRKGFRFAGRITKHLAKYKLGKTYNMYLNDDSTRVERPFGNNFALKETRRDKFSEFETFEVRGLDGGIDAIGWLLHHNYYGALPQALGIRGLRLRLGNMQVGADNVFEVAFPEPRFNSWSVGEVHVLCSRLVPNGRRDDLEQNIHYQNLLNHVSQHARRVAKLCRTKSSERNARQRLQHNNEVSQNDIRNKKNLLISLASILKKYGLTATEAKRICNAVQRVTKNCSN